MEKDPRFNQAVKEHIVLNGAASSVAEITEANFDEKVMAFQESKKILVDGRIGPVTLWNLQYDLALSDKKLKLVRVRADKPPPKGGYEGYNGMRLREDAAAAFEKLAQNVRAAGAIVTTSGGLRDLGARPDANQSATSFHYPGLAFDLAISTGGWSLERDPYVLEWTPDAKRWIVWARAEGGQEHSFEATVHSGTWGDVQVARKAVTGKFVNFTEIAAAEGFVAIGPRPYYRRDTAKQYLSSEWWHFQYEAALTPHFSQFGIELLKVEGYDSFWRAVARGMQPNNVWRNRMLVFNETWN